jgi:murein L,D-transpeptidase YafK
MRAVRLILALCVVVLAGAAAVVVTNRDEVSIEVARASLPFRLGAKDLKLGEQVFIRVFKQESELELWMRSDRGWKLFHSYAICRWSGALGPKLRTGDRQAPEGFYRVGLAQLNPNSRWHKSFNIGFPNEYDRTHGRTGSYLMVHGG